jgi:hypothetical protein
LKKKCTNVLIIDPFGIGRIKKIGEKHGLP